MTGLYGVVKGLLQKGESLAASLLIYRCALGFLVFNRSVSPESIYTALPHCIDFALVPGKGVRPIKGFGGHEPV